MENFTDKIYQCKNGHLICEYCISQLEKRECPTCRVSLADRIRNLFAEECLERKSFVKPGSLTVTSEHEEFLRIHKNVSTQGEYLIIFYASNKMETTIYLSHNIIVRV